MSNSIFLNHLESITQDEWKNQINDTDKYRLILSVSGYEERSTYWVSLILESIHKSDMNQFLVVGFRNLSNKLSRPKNDDFYKNQGLSVRQLDSDDWPDFLKVLDQKINEIRSIANEKPIEIHVDYSCMPRRWYCRLPFYLEKYLRSKDKAYFWYSPGEYPDAEYPTAGIEDFHVFSGKPSLSAKFRTHIFGLGFDKIRSQAIWSVLDPANLVCFYTDPGSKEGYVERVKKDNKEIMLSADYIFTIPMHDFVHSYSKITGIVREFRSIGDVILVPDGPKPLILASSIVPSYLKKIGIVCFHVSRRKPHDYKLVDVRPSNEKPYGFFFHGPHEENNIKY